MRDWGLTASKMGDKREKFPAEDIFQYFEKSESFRPIQANIYDLPSFPVHLKTYLISAHSTSMYKAYGLLTSGIRDSEDNKKKPHRGFSLSPANSLHWLGECVGPGTWAKVLQANSSLLALATFYSLSWKTTQHSNTDSEDYSKGIIVSLVIPYLFCWWTATDSSWTSLRDAALGQSKMCRDGDLEICWVDLFL